MTITIVYKGECLTCGETFGPGDEKVDKQVEKHGKTTKHSTVTRISKEER